MTGRTGSAGLRWIGTAIGLTGILNLALSIISMKLGSITGIAVATVIAQSGLSLQAGRYLCWHFGAPWLPWTLRSWVMPFLAVSLAAGLRMEIPLNSVRAVALLGGCYAAILLMIALVLKITPALIREEWAAVRGMLKG